jgi:hypothetical protein
MLIYRFRITCEELDGFLREIEIQPNQTFLDFHHIILDSSELLHCDRASFFMTDKKYIKDREISLKPEKRMVRKYDDDLDQVVTEAVVLPLMKTAKLKDYIEDPHQKMIYEFAGRDHFSFHIELFKIFQSDGISSYPRCIKQLKELPKKAEIPTAVPDVPVVPKVVLPRIPLPKIDGTGKFDDIVEDESELAAIESELEDLLEEEAVEVLETPDTGSSTSDDFSFGEEESGDEDENLEHIEDYEDIESLDKRLKGYEGGSDDY